MKVDVAGMAVMLVLGKAVLRHVHGRQHLHGDKQKNE